MASYLTHLLIVGLIWSLLTLSLNLQYGLTGLLNYGQIWFFAIGAYTSAVFLRNGLPIWLEPFTAMAAAIVGAWLIAQPTRRLEQAYWALVTFGVAEGFRLILINERWIAGGSIGTMGILPIGSPRVMAFVLLVLVAATFLMNERIYRSPFGRIIRIIREDEVMAAALGRDVYTFQVRVLMLGAAVAAVAGVAYAHYFSFVDPEAFTPIETFWIWIMVILGGRGNNLGVVIGAMVLEGITESTRFLSAWVHLPPIFMANLRMLIFGILLIVIVLYRREGIFPERKRVYRLPALPDLPPEPVPAAAPPGAAMTGEPALPDRAPHDHPGLAAALRIEGITKRFGGVEALRDITMLIRPGSGVTGIIGPNGSGKSTLFNVITGIMPKDAGAVFLDGRMLDTSRGDLVARQGIVRTFQIPKVARQMTVVENLMTGPMGQRGEHLIVLFSPLAHPGLRREEDSHLEGALAVMNLLGLRHVANEYAGTLSGGQLKLLSLGIALMSDSRVMLLDEPTAGVNPILIHRITRTLKDLSAGGHTLACIEHNMQVIAGICEIVYVLDAGQVIATGSPDAVRRDPAVIAAYLGSRAEPAG
jgi:ABC-type branched-subunit amino acid transport system ATPase component/ABC-type branched-subunit amino acid transport system permease subunit